VTDSSHYEALLPSKQLLNKFLLPCAVLVAYFGYLRLQYGVLTSGVASLLT